MNKTLLISGLITVSLIVMGIIYFSTLSSDEPQIDEPLTNQQMLTLAAEDIKFNESYSEDIVLPRTGLYETNIFWTMDSDLIPNNTIERPSFEEGDRTVTITATITLNGETIREEYTINLIAYEE